MVIIMAFLSEAFTVSVWEKSPINSVNCTTFFFAILSIPQRLCFRGLRDPEPDRGLAVKVNPRERLHTRAELGWVSPLPPHYSCEASGRNVTASNGHRWCCVTSQVISEFLVLLLHSFKVKTTVHHHMTAQMPMCTLTAKLYSWTRSHNWIS